MDTKKQYNLKDRVWIHIGEPKLVEGRIVDIFDLEHLKEGHSKDAEYYVIEIPTSIEKVYEVRTYEQISSSSKGPINLFKNDLKEGERYLKKVGIVLPKEETVVPSDELPVAEDSVTKPKKKFYHRKKKTAIAQ